MAISFVTFDRRSEPPWVASAYRGTWKRVDCVTEAGILFTPGAYAYEKESSATAPARVGRVA